MTLTDKVIAAAAAAAIGLSGIARADEINPNGWPVPDIKKAKLLETHYIDNISEIPGKDTTVRDYRSPNGNYFATMSYRGKIYAIDVDTDGKAPWEYVLVDMDGDGRFELKELPRGTAETPYWIVRQSYNK